MTNYDFEIEFEAQIGALEIDITANLSVNYSSHSGSQEHAPEEEIKVVSKDITEKVYYIDAEEVSEKSANQYYKDYINQHHEEIHLADLNTFCKMHLEAVIDDKINDYLNTI